MPSWKVFCAALAFPLAALAAPSQVIPIDTGLIQGSAKAGIESWKGIPFAKPPLGRLRWRAPQPAPRWNGVRKTIAYGHDCEQLPVPGDYARLETAPAEDCLYLNVWRPAAFDARRPVIVWIHGGGFVNGGTSPQIYSGANIARQNVVFVSFNYRLGRFGTFAHPQLTRENADAGLLGNYNFLDQIAALRWVERNIAAFGGDPANVTIVGESAGGMSVLNLLTSPLAEGLFAKAVVMSGGDGEMMMEPGGLAEAEAEGARFARSVGIAPDDRRALAKLRALPADKVTSDLNMLTLFRPEAPQTYSSPFADGRIAVNLKAAIEAGAFSRTPVMIGATSGDMGGETGFMIAGARSLARSISRQGVPVYAYRFSYVPDSLRNHGDAAGHATDVPFFFDTQAIRYGGVATAKDNSVGRSISAYLVSFAKTGNPNGAGRPAWPEYDAAADVLMDFGSDGLPTAKRDPLGARIDGVKR
jgi:para-nitrobenzyl esterase